jgi:hypothetical protein
VKQLLRSKSSHHKAFIFVLELGIAFILFLSFISVAYIKPSYVQDSIVSIKEKDTLSNALTIIDRNGYLLEITDSNGYTADQKMDLIYSKISSMIPSSYETRISLQNYQADLNSCKLNKTFQDCFIELNSYSPRGATLPLNKGVFHERLFLPEKEQALQCTLGASFAPLENNFPQINQIPSIKKLLFSENNSQSRPKLFFASSPDLNINFDVNISPTGSVACDQNVRVDFNITIPSLGRSPANIMLIQDKSGSMSWDGLLDLTDPRDVYASGNYAYVADGSAGLRDINIQSPESPSILGTYNSSGTASGVSVLGNYAYVADGTNGLVVSNITNKSSPTLAATLTGIGTASEISTLGNYAYVVTTAAGATNFADFNISGSQNFDLNMGKLSQDLNIGATGLDNNNYNIGLTGANYAISQSFVAASNSIRAVSIYIRKTASQNPSANLTIQLRTALPGSGSTLATGTLARDSTLLTTTKSWIDIDFGSDIAITSGQTYYLVLSTSETHASRYYQWYSRTSSPSIYTSGQAYVTTTAHPNTDAFLQTKTSISQAAQSFVPSSNSIRLVSLYLRRNPTGSAPASNLTVYLRQTISGANIATATITAATPSASYAWVDADFGSNITIDPALTYYIVASTTASSSTNFYQWAALNSNPYANGNAYSQTTSLANTDAFIRTNHRARTGLQLIDISNPLSPIHKSSVSGTDPVNIFTSGSYAYFTDGSAGLKVIDISNAISPTLLGSVDTTDAGGVSINGNYAYVADGSSGLRIIDVTTKSAPSILSTYNTSGTAYDAFYYSDGNVYVADNSSLLAINVSTPASPTLMKTFLTAYDYQKVFVLNDWAYLTPGYNGSLISFNIHTGPKINQTQTASNSFIDNNSWRSLDKIGIVSFSSSATTDRTLLTISDTNKALLKSTIDSLVASGSTAIGDAINAATTELRSARASVGGYKFEVLLSDGQSNSGADPITAANTAADNNIKIYTIGFGSDADLATLQSIASITDANYYAASDVNALQGIYDLIAVDIGEFLASGKTKAYDANLTIPVPDCSFIPDSGSGTCQKIGDSNYLVYTVGYIDSTIVWRNHFIMNVPCDSAYSCSLSSITFPSPGTLFYWKNSEGVNQTPIAWDVNKTLTFNYRDLAIQILNASINSSGEVILDINVKNRGTLSSAPTDVNFYLDDPNTGSFLNSAAISALNPGEYRLLLGERLFLEGWIYAVLNKDYIIHECPGNNIASVYCSGAPSTQYMVLDVWMWKK